MKKTIFPFLTLCFLFTLNIFAQKGDIVLNFEAKDANSGTPVLLESVLIQNISKSCDTTIYGEAPYLFLSWPSAIDEFGVNHDRIILKPNFPNPFIYNTKFNLVLWNHEYIRIFITDVFGSVVSELKTELSGGIHSFEIYTGNSGFYFLTVSNGELSKTMKLVCQNSGNIRRNEIWQIGSDLQADFKSSGLNGYFSFVPGDQLALKATAAGYSEKTIYDNPDENTSYTFDLQSQIIVTLPTVTTLALTEIGQNTAASGGNVTNDGNGTVNTRGVCWSTTLDPTINNYKTVDGSGMGNFTSNLTGLIENATYYLRAYATNEAGTAYGNQLSFVTLTIPTVTTNQITEITQNTATCGGNVTGDGGSSFTTRGVCWSTMQNPEINDFHTVDGSGMGDFVSYITGLSENTTYYVRAYATNEVGTAYGNQLSFVTLTIPTVITNLITEITQNTATSGGNVISDGGASVTIKGICWSTTQNPDINDFHTADGSGIGDFISYLTGLSENTTYYLRAYATNEVGTSYGNQQSFSTLAIPTVITNPVTDITQNTATCGGNVTHDGGATVTIKGVCWSTTQNPDINDFHTVDGSGTGGFVSYLTGLAENETYYLRAFATNEVGTSYGNQLSFTTLTIPTVVTNPVTDITQNTATCGGEVTNDGGTSVTFRGVCWSITQNPTTDDDHTVDGFGTGVFTSLLTGLNSNTSYFVRAYATNGVGTSYGNQFEFTTLDVANVNGHIYYAGTTIPISGVNVQISDIAGTSQSNGFYELIGVPVGTWTITATKTNYDPFSQTIEVITGVVVFDIEMTTGNYTHMVSGTITNQFGNAVPDVNVVVLNPNGTPGNLTATSDLSGYYQITGVPQGPRIVRFYKEGFGLIELSIYMGNSNVQLNAELLEFGLPCPGFETVDYEGQTYHTILIGDQCWFKENLNVGIMQGPSNNGVIDKYCYDNDPSNCEVYGGLYRWDEMMQYTNIQGARGICPTGWHIPTDAEWLNLTNYIKNQDDFLCNANTSWISKSMATTTLWNPSTIMCAIGKNPSANNLTGFSGPAAGYYSEGPYYHKGSRGHWWTSTLVSGVEYQAWYRGVSYNDGLVDRNWWNTAQGNSVRCLKD